MVPATPPWSVFPLPRKVAVRLPGKGNSWREAGPPNHHDNTVDSDQQVVNEELSLFPPPEGGKAKLLWEAGYEPFLLDPKAERKKEEEVEGAGIRPRLGSRV